MIDFSCFYFIFHRLKVSPVKNLVLTTMANSELAEFDAVFSEIVQELTRSGLKLSETEDAYTWFKEVSIDSVIWF